MKLNIILYFVSNCLFYFRIKVKWCSEMDCKDVKTHCNNLSSDYKDYQNLLRKFGKHRIAAIRLLLLKCYQNLYINSCRYEDLKENTDSVTKNLIMWSGLEWSVKIRRYIVQHTKR